MVVETGIKEIPFVIPPDHVYVDAPVPDKVTIVPGQTLDDGETLYPTVGDWFTVTTLVAVAVQPFAAVPVTV